MNKINYYIKQILKVIVFILIGVPVIIIIIILRILTRIFSKLLEYSEKTELMVNKFFDSVSKHVNKYL